MRLLPALIVGIPMIAQSLAPHQERADRFLKLVNAAFQSLTAVQQEALWAASTDVKPENDAAAEWSGKAGAAFNGNPALILEARELLKFRSQLNPITVRELERVLFNAADAPMTNPKLTNKRITMETKQNSTQNGFTFNLEGKPISANGLDKILNESTDPAERLKAWNASKEIGPVLRDGLVELRDLRNGCAQELGYKDFFFRVSPAFTG